MDEEKRMRLPESICFAFSSEQVSDVNRLQRRYGVNSSGDTEVKVRMPGSGLGIFLR